MIKELYCVNMSTGEEELISTLDTRTLRTQNFLRMCVNDCLDEYKFASISDINRWTWENFGDELIEREIEWTYQHLIASARKHLVDNDIVHRSVVDGETTYFHNPEFCDEDDD